MNPHHKHRKRYEYEPEYVPPDGRVRKQVVECACGAQRTLIWYGSTVQKTETDWKMPIKEKP